MPRALTRLTSLLATTVLLVSLTSCSDDSPADPAVTPGAVATSSEGFDGAGVSTETITANNMEITVPEGFRLPEDTLVTEALPASIMMADEDPTAVTEMVTASAAEAGYEVYAETTDQTVFVGHGNAVMFTAGPMVQMLTWGPEAMKDVLAAN